MPSDQGSGIKDQAALLSALQSKIRLDELLARYTTARVGGPAATLIEVTSADELAEVVIAARKVGMPFLTLGGGSNVLVADAGVPGLTIINKAKGIEFREGDRVWCESGTVLPTLARECMARGLGGLEWAVGVPGTVGGAVVGNAGAHGRDIAATLISATILSDEVREWSNQELEFAYRSSRIKRSAVGNRRSAVVLAATFQLTPGDRLELEHKASEYSEYRRRTQPPGASIGSMFKNPPGDAAGRLIDQCGLKGTRIGDAEISTIHANFFVNHGSAKARDVKALIDLARQRVFEKFGIELELEIELIGEYD
jgi:UDP-N-acetylmuramate dehydrogenase